MDGNTDYFDWINSHQEASNQPSTKKYLEIANDHLFDPKYYEIIEIDPLNKIIIDTNESLLKSLQNKKISKKMFNNLIIDPNEKVNLGNFRLLPKLHKINFQ